MMNRFLLFLLILLLAIALEAQNRIVVKDISFTGNERTKIQVIERELTFSKGDTLDTEEFRKQLQRSRENIYNLHLFNFVEADTTYDGDGGVAVHFRLLERWYFWPVPIVEHAGRNFAAWLYEGEWDRVNYGIFLVADNVRGRNETFMLKIRPGWREQYGFLYSFPALNRKKTMGLEITYSTFRQKIFLLNTRDNKPAYFVSDDYCYFQDRARVTMSYRPSLYFKHYFTAQYNHFRITDGPLAENPSYIGNNETESDFLSIAYQPELDKRNIVAFPTKGYYIGTRFEYSASPPGKGRVDVWQAGILASGYQPAGSRFFFSSGLDAAWNNNRNRSFLFDQAIGYNNYIRGYELYTINGNAYWLQKSEVNYNLVKTRTRTFGKKEKYHKFLKLHYALYLSAFSDMGYVHSDVPVQTYQNSFQYGYGLGLNLVTYYDWVWRLEYSVNRYGENRVYLHFHAAF